MNGGKHLRVTLIDFPASNGLNVAVLVMPVPQVNEDYYLKEPRLYLVGLGGGAENH